MEVDTSVMIILVMSWNTSMIAHVWLSWFCHKIVMDVHAWQKTRPTVTNTYHHESVFFVVMLLYYPFWMFMGFILYIYIIFGTNLLTGGPARIAVFLPISVFRKKRNIKRSPNGMKPSGAWFLERTWSRGLGVQVKKQPRQPRGWGRAHPYRARPLSRGPLGQPPTHFFLLYIPTYPENIQGANETQFPLP